MNFVTCDLVGPSNIGGIHYYGLANQMFQIATVLSYANQNNLTPLFPMLKEDKFGNYTDSVFRNLNLTEYDPEKIQHIYQQNKFSYEPIPKYKNIIISGYFQSEKYFAVDKNLILESFAPPQETTKYLKDKYGEILNDSLSIHFRFGDYKKIQDHHPLISKTDYYRKILKLNKRKNILIFSDDINKTKKIKELKNYDVYFISDENEVHDLYLMSLCNDNAIANSSFSWWGAWLNQNIDKKVYYPSIWFGPSKQEFDTKDLFPSDWNLILTKKKKFMF